jgi:hypothetical protein
LRVLGWIPRVSGDLEVALGGESQERRGIAATEGFDRRRELAAGREREALIVEDVDGEIGRVDADFSRVAVGVTAGAGDRVPAKARQQMGDVGADLASGRSRATACRSRRRGRSSVAARARCR